MQAVVGEAFFRTMARAFVEGALPVQPVLAEYGEDFPRLHQRVLMVADSPRHSSKMSTVTHYCLLRAQFAAL